MYLIVALVFKHILHIVLVFLSLTLNKKIPARDGWSNFFPPWNLAV